MDFAGKSVVITGASSGIGKMLGHKLLEQDARVAFVGRDRERLERAINESSFSHHAIALSADVARLDDLKRLVSETVDAFGGIDILINSAGIGYAGDLSDVTFEEIEYAINVNLTGIINLSKLSLPYIEKSTQGMIVNIGSLACLVAIPYHWLYCATKFGLNGFSHALRRQLINRNIHVMVVYLGATDTPMVSADFRAKAKDVGMHLDLIDPSSAVNTIIEGMRKRKPVVHPQSHKEKILRLLQHWFPFLVEKGMIRDAPKLREVLLSGNKYFRE